MSVPNSDNKIQLCVLDDYLLLQGNIFLFDYLIITVSMFLHVPPYLAKY